MDTIKKGFFLLFLFFPLEMATYYNYHKGIQGDNRIQDSLGSDTEPLLRKLVYNLSLMELYGRVRLIRNSTD